ncbi:hypothetical protein [Haloferax sp. DFSO60]|uniref:hypothetical protein n=1 Tax=Haloferax sp. DFSO60 TaxID=3388652 RepID=UPI00397B00DA
MVRFLFPVALLVILSGCVGAPVATDDVTTTSSVTTTTTDTPTETTTTQTATATPTTTAVTPTTTTSTPSYTGCNASLYVDTVESVPDDEPVVQYSELPVDRRSEFDHALSGSVTFSEQSEAYSYWVELRYVEKDGQTFTNAIAIC